MDSLPPDLRNLVLRNLRALRATYVCVKCTPGTGLVPCFNDDGEREASYFSTFAKYYYLAAAMFHQGCVPRVLGAKEE